MTSFPPARRRGIPSRPYTLTLVDIETMVIGTRLRSVTATATELGLNNPSIVRRLRKLEERVGTQLFDGLPSSIELTPAGRALLPLATAAYEPLLALEDFVAEHSPKPSRTGR